MQSGLADQGLPVVYLFGNLWARERLYFFQLSVSRDPDGLKGCCFQQLLVKNVIGDVNDFFYMSSL